MKKKNGELHETTAKYRRKKNGNFRSQIQFLTFRRRNRIFIYNFI